jgi:toxin-antitoxin system PIN domain toxin
MNAIDTNILVYAHNDEAPEHPIARSLMTKLGQSDVPCGIAWPSIYEFLRVITHPVIGKNPLETKQALAIVDTLCSSPNFVILGAARGHWAVARKLLQPIHPIGNAAFDVQIAAILISSEVDVLFTRDKRFSSFGMRVVNPFTN